MQLCSVSLHAGAQGPLTAAPGLSPGKPVPHGLMKSSSEGLVVGGLPLRPPPQHIQDPLKFIIRFIFLFPPLDLSPWQQFSQLHFISFSANLFLFPPIQSLFSHPLWVCSPSRLSFHRPLCAGLFLRPHSHLSLRV